MFLFVLYLYCIVSYFRHGI